jgi:thiamine-phosphate diphosphorylase
MGSRGALVLRAGRMAQERSARFVELALTLVEEQERNDAWLVINERVDVAMIVCARGVQLTGNSLEVSDALRVLTKTGQCGAEGSCAIGASVHSLEEGISARLAGATWGVVSDVLAARGGDGEEEPGLPTDTDGAGSALLERLVRHSGIPIVAIGGIVPQHVAPLRRAGAHGVAAIRGIWDVDHSERAVLDYLSAYDSEVGR